MIEANVEEHFVATVKRLGGETRKVKWPGRRGAPDRLALIPARPKPGREKGTLLDCRTCGYDGAIRPARHPFVELKRPKGGRLEPHQEREHQRLRAAGFEVLVLDSIEAIDKWAASL